MALIALLTGAGCGIVRKLQVPVIAPHHKANFTVQINVADAANQNSPLPVDFVMIDDKRLMLEVAKMSAKDWYERRAQVQRDFPSKVQILSWEWVPGYHVGPIEIDIKARILAAFLFADYSNTGEHRAYVDVRSPIVVNFGAEEFSVQPLK